MFVATYNNGLRIVRKQVAADGRDDAYTTALNRTPPGYKLTNLRQQTQTRPK